MEHPTSTQKTPRSKTLYADLLDQIKKGERSVLATIIHTQGSVPQIPGTSALFSKEGLLRGTLGGGILEASAQKIALAALDKEESTLFDFDLTSDTISEEEAICGGTVKILIDAQSQLHQDAFQNLHDSSAKRRSGVLATFIDRNFFNRLQIKRQWVESRDFTKAELDSSLIEYKDEMQRTLSKGRPSLIQIRKSDVQKEGTDRWLYLEPVVPYPRLVIAGAGHIGQAVAHMGRFLQFEVTVIDDRAEFANKERIPDADHFFIENIPQAVADFPIGPDTYIVIVTRDHSCDTETLRACISSPAAYIGMIGSERKVKIIRETFLQQGWVTAEEFGRVHAPIGLEIQSTTIEEIAVSIAAQLVLVRSKKKETEENKR